MDKIVKLPISSDQRKINKKGEGCVPCQTSGRWLNFDDHVTPDLNFIFVDVMSESNHKICQLCLKIDDIERALKIAKQ